MNDGIACFNPILFGRDKVPQLMVLFWSRHAIQSAIPSSLRMGDTEVYEEMLYYCQLSCLRLRGRNGVWGKERSLIC